jgi:hypothetical protein
MRLVSHLHVLLLCCPSYAVIFPGHSEENFQFLREL